MIIHRTIIRELLHNLMVVVFSLSVILFMEKFVRLTRLFMGKGADLSDIFKIFIFLQPSILVFSVPMAIMIAIFLTYGRMASDNEIVILRSSGMSFFGVSRAALTLSFVSLIMLLSISLFILPRSMFAFKHILHETIVKKAHMTLEPGTFSDVFKGTVIYVREMPSKDEVRGIFIYKNADKSMTKPVVIVAEQGLVSSNPTDGLIKLSMKNGLIHTYKEESSSEISFSEYDFILSSGVDTMQKIKPDVIDSYRLWNGRKGNVSWAIEIHRRIALPFACIIFGILGPALSNKIGKIGRLGGFSLSLVILISYYMLLVLGEGLAKSGKVSAFVGIWTPNMIFSLIAVILFYMAYREKPLKRF